VGVKAGDNFASTTGEYLIGTVQQKYTGTSTIVAKVMLGGAAAATLRSLQLVMSVSTGPSPVAMIRVISGTLAGGSSTELGFSLGDNPPYLVTPSQGVFVGGITFNTTTRAITARWLEILPTFPDPGTVADGAAYVEIGSVAWDADNNVWVVNNTRYGPITATICRDWFAAEAPFNSVTWS
jgi:hypothetical protein